MCGRHTEKVVLPKPTPAPAETARFSTRIKSDAVSGIEAGQRGRIRSLSDLRLTDSTLSTTE
jgi:hypothetical protein